MSVPAFRSRRAVKVRTGTAGTVWHIIILKEYKSNRSPRNRPIPQNFANQVKCSIATKWLLYLVDDDWWWWLLCVRCYTLYGGEGLLSIPYIQYITFLLHHSLMMWVNASKCCIYVYFVISNNMNGCLWLLHSCCSDLTPTVVKVGLWTKPNP